MAERKKEIDVAWIPQAQSQLGTTQEPLLVQAFLLHRSWLRDQKEEAIQARALEKIDQVYANNKDPITCTAGCSACCHARVDVSKHEKRLILGSMKDHKVKIDKERLALQVQALQEGRWDQLPFADRQCVLLDESKRCSIYASRPLLCRRYFVSSDRTYCETEDWSHVVRQFNPDADAYLSAVFTKFKFEPLPVFIQQNLKKFASNADDGTE